MAALSYYSNWEEPFQQQMMDSDILTINGDDDPELQAMLHGAWNSDFSFVNPNDDFFFSDQTCNNSLLHHHFTNQLLPFSPHPLFPTQEIDHLEPFCKRQKRCDSDQIYSSLFAPDPFLTMLQDYHPSPPFLDIPAAGYNSINGISCESARKEEAAGAAAPQAVSLSAQSAAARQRRRRITEKTQELGKLVPGGQKMNTAEMLQSAYKYIKFLQAQAALLEFVGLTNQEVAEEASFEGEEMLQILLESSLIQEKLSSTENCLVPHKFVDEKIVKLIESKFASTSGKGSVI